MSSLSVSIVTYFSDDQWFKSTCAALFAAIAHARAHAGLDAADVYLIDNSDDNSDTTALFAGVTCTAAHIHILSGHGNVGYGAGHNLSLLATEADYHLVLNPDVTMRRNAITQALLIMAARKDAMCITPNARDTQGAFASLCKRRVTPLILGLRAFGSASMRARYQKLLDAYEYRGELGAEVKEVLTASGAFMLLNARTAQKLGGFDSQFFLHFEDVDLSLRLHARGKILYAPEVIVVHAGGNAAVKHGKHILKNGAKYFRKWGLGDPLKRLPKIHRASRSVT